MNGNRRRLDPADRLGACLDTPIVDPGRLPVPQGWPLPNSTARRFDFDQAVPSPAAPAPGGDPEAARFADLLKQAHYRMFPPHLYPPLLSEPYILRAQMRAAYTGTGRLSERVLAWACPSGRAFAIQEAHLRAATGYVVTRVGFRLFRNSSLLFDGDELRTRNPDGSESVQPEVLSVSNNEPAAIMTTPFTCHVLPGDRLTIDITGTRTANVTLTASLQLRGYLYPTELLS
jgi:hypothetical protein